AGNPPVVTTENTAIVRPVKTGRLRVQNVEIDVDDGTLRPEPKRFEAQRRHGRSSYARFAGPTIFCVVDGGETHDVVAGQTWSDGRRFRVAREIVSIVGMGRRDELPTAGGDAPKSDVRAHCADRCGRTYGNADIAGAARRWRIVTHVVFIDHLIA